MNIYTNKKYYFLSILFLISKVYLLFGQTINPTFKNYTIDEGLSQSTITSILQDTEGYIWLASEEGLNRFDGYNFKVFRRNTEDSTTLSSNYVLSIYEDNQQQLWVGTYGGGLNKFNREFNSFTSFLHNPKQSNTLSNNNVKCIFQDSDSNLWIGTTGGGLNLFIDSTESFISYKKISGNKNSLSNNRVNVIYEDANNNLWIGTEYGLNKFNYKNKLFKTYYKNSASRNSIINNTVQAICEGSNQTIWIGTQKGLSLFNFEKDTFLTVPIELKNKDITSLSYANNLLWIGTSGEGIFVYNDNKDELTSIKRDITRKSAIQDNIILSIYRDRTNNLWFGTRSNGISYLDIKSFEFKKYTSNSNLNHFLKVNSIHGFNQTEKDEIWIATYGGGVYRLNKATGDMVNYKYDSNNPYSISNNHVWVVYVDNNKRLWLATRGGGLNLFNPQENHFHHFKHNENDSNSISQNIIRSIYQDKKGYLWIGTDGKGLDRYDEKNGKFTNFHYKFNDSTSISNNYIFHITQTEEDKLWVGTNGGLNLLNTKTGVFQRFQHDSNNPKSISSNRIRSIYQDTKGRLWIGTSTGLNLFNTKEKSFKYWLEKDGLSNNVIYGILEDSQGYLWLSTNKGINKFNPEKEVFTHYDKYDGLQANEFNNYSYFKDNEGVMYFGGIKGFNVFHPDSIKENKQVPNVVISSFFYFNKEVKTIKSPSSPEKENAGYLIKYLDGEKEEVYLSKNIAYLNEITLNYEDEIFGFEFSALNFRQAEKNKFQYKLENFDNDWIDTDYLHRRITYSKVPYGRYTFRVRASNDDGYWNNEGVALVVRILPPWWLTWWMKLIYLLIVIGGPILFYFHRVNSFRQRKIELEELVNERTNEIKQQKEELEIQAEELRITNEKLVELDEYRDAMTGMIVHDLKNPLNAIIGLTESEYNTEHRGVLNQSGKSMLNLVTNILEVQKFEDASISPQVSSEKLINIINSAIKEVALLIQEKNHKLIIEVEGLFWVKVDVPLIQRVFINLLTNAIKFTPVNGKIIISAHNAFSEDKITIKVKDTGVGIPPAEVPLIFDKFKQVKTKNSGKTRSTGLGLTFCKMAIESHDCTINVESTLNEGTTFIFDLPLVRYEVVTNEKEQKVVLFQESDSIISNLTPQEINILMPYVNQMKNYEVFDVSAIRKILKTIESDSMNIKSWSEALEKTLFTCNQEEFLTLLFIK